MLLPYNTNCPFGLISEVRPFIPPNTLLKSFLFISSVYIYPGTFADGLDVRVIMFLFGQDDVHSVKEESNICDFLLSSGSNVIPTTVLPVFNK